MTIKDNVPLSYIRYSCLKNDYMPSDRYHIHINALYDDKDIYQKLEQFKNNNLDNSLFVIAVHAN